MTQPEALSREELYRNWLAWVTTNLRDDPKYAAIAANAAADAAVKGDGFNAAVAAATNAWIEAAQGDKPLWRPGFRSLLFTDLYFWALLVLLVTIPLYWVVPELSLFAVLIPLALIGVGWKVYVFLRLSRRGIVVPGSMFNVTVKDSDGAVYRTTYEFNYEGQHFISRLSRESTPEIVLILFDPKHPKFAMVMPELLNPGG
jgi:hypothetical protein